MYSEASEFLDKGPSTPAGDLENTSMKTSAIRSLLQLFCVVAVLAVIAIPLSNLMMAQADTSVEPVQATVETTQSAETSSAVSALMAGSAVGPSRGARLTPRHPASAFIP